MSSEVLVVTPCGEGCANIDWEGHGTFAHAHLIGGFWRWDVTNDDAVCEDGSRVHDAGDSHTEIDAILLRGTARTTWRKTCPGGSTDPNVNDIVLTRAATPTQAAPHAARPDDDEFVALAISPNSIGSGHSFGGFGTSGTQERANQIALSECRATHGNDECLLVNAGMFHGCVAYATNPNNQGWAGGSGADADQARTEATRRLGMVPAPSNVYARCSTPPGN
jgi:hypothetical protein